MADDDRDIQEAGPIDPEKCPDLALLVGIEDAPWKPAIQPAADAYPLALVALEQQDRWGTATHAQFWAGLLARWPRRRGNRALRGQLAAAVARWRGLGHTDAAIADALGYPPDSLRRMGVLSDVADRNRRARAVDVVSRAEATISAVDVLKSASLADMKSAELLAEADRAMARHAPPRLPRIVLADREGYVVGRDRISPAALSDADRRARQATRDLIDRAERTLLAQRHRAA